MRDPKSLQGRRSWRDYQNQLRKPVNRLPRGRLALALSVVSMLIFCLYMGWPSTGATNIAPAATAITPAGAEKALISKKDVGLLLRRLDLNDLMAEELQLPFKDQQFTIETSLDLGLQNRLVDAMDRRNSRYIGIVVLDPGTGRVLALAGFDKTDPDANPCLRSTFPAASLFKIVTAAAAVDQCSYTGKTRVRFNGYKHTLYKSQLKETNNRYTHTLSFAASFAESINPVFGKLGELHLGKAVLEEYGLGFGFNQPLDFELPVAPSHLAVNGKPYHWAEIASGFNNETTLSPLHAALIVAAVLNQGRMVQPTLVQRIVDSDGREIYRARSDWLRRSMTSKASTVLTAMMESTVRYGTARKAFRGSSRDPVLKHLSIGGKTGSIFNRRHDARFDWFAGFAQAKDGTGRLVVAALVAHEEYIGIRAGTYARMAMSYYFRKHLARQDGTRADSDS